MSDGSDDDGHHIKDALKNFETYVKTGGQKLPDVKTTKKNLRQTARVTFGVRHASQGDINHDTISHLALRSSG